MPLPEDSLRVAVCGAASLRGQDLKLCMEESGFPVGQVRLFDEEALVGTLTEVSGEAAFIQTIDGDSFKKLRFVFFAGSRAFAGLHGPAAVRAGATVIDLTGELASVSGARSWIPRLDSILSPPGNVDVAELVGQVVLAPSAPAIVASSLCAAASDFAARRIAITFFAPVSERGKEGVEELSEQMVKLLSLQSIPQAVFDCQVAFNMLDRWGSDSPEKLARERDQIVREVKNYLGGRVPLPAISLIQAPVFYGHTFSAFVEFAGPLDLAALTDRLEAAGFQMVDAEDPGPSNLSVAGESKAALRVAQPDEGVTHGYWFWGAADNHRLPVSNAIQIAEKILVS